MTPKKIAAFALGPLGGALLGFITLPIITWYFSQEDIGRLAMLNVVISFSTLLFSLGLDQAYVREFHESKNKPALFKMTLLPGLLLLSITLGGVLSLDNVISYWLFELESKFLSLLVAVVLLSTFIGRFLSLILRMNEQGVAYSMSQILPKLLLIAVIGSYVVFSASKNITNLVLANVAATLFVCIIYGWNTRAEWFAGLKEKIDYTYLKSLLSFGIPLIFGGLAFWGLTATDKILLKELSSFEQLGLYSVAVSFAAAASIFQSIFTTVWAPTVYKWAAAGEGLEKIYKVNRYVLLAVIILFCLAGLFSWVVVLILPSNYNAVQWILISCLGLPLLYTLSETTVVGIGITKRSGFAMLGAILAFIVNLLGNWWLIPIFGAAGAAASTCISFWVFLILRTEFAIYVWKPIPRLAIYSYSTLMVMGAVINSLYGKNYDSQLMIFWLLILLSTLIFFRNEVAEMKLLVKSRVIKRVKA
jgi:O-antigen/teichoic acid export membrane protein